MSPEETLFILRLTEKFADTPVGFLKSNYVSTMILAQRDQGTRTRGLFISSQPLGEYYPISERIRLYFQFVSEQLEIMNQEEIEFAIWAFRKYYDKFSSGTDTWEILASAPPILNEYWRIFLGWEVRQNSDTSFLFNAIVNDTDRNIEIPGSIAPKYLSYLKTEQAPPEQRWARCSTLLKMI